MRGLVFSFCFMVLTFAAVATLPAAYSDSTTVTVSSLPATLTFSGLTTATVSSIATAFTLPGVTMTISSIGATFTYTGVTSSTASTTTFSSTTTPEYPKGLAVVILVLAQSIALILIRRRKFRRDR